MRNFRDESKKKIVRNSKYFIYLSKVPRSLLSVLLVLGTSLTTEKSLRPALSQD